MERKATAKAYRPDDVDPTGRDKGVDPYRRTNAADAMHAVDQFMQSPSDDD